KSSGNIAVGAPVSHCKTISIMGADIQIESKGEGFPAIFIHGFGGDLHSWDSVWDFLPANRLFIRYDLRGYGSSIARYPDLFTHAEDLLALLDALDIQECDLVGASMGGSIAINLALQQPAKVRSLGLISPGLTAWEWSEDWHCLWNPIVEA